MSTHHFNMLERNISRYVSIYLDIFANFGSKCRLSSPISSLYRPVAIGASRQRLRIGVNANCFCLISLNERHSTEQLEVHELFETLSLFTTAHSTVRRTVRVFECAKLGLQTRLNVAIPPANVTIAKAIAWNTAECH